MTKTNKTRLAIFLGAFWACSAFATDEGGFVIKNFLKSGIDANLVSIEAGYHSGVKSGEVLHAVRPARAGVKFPVETGVLKVVAVHEFDSIAEVVSQGTRDSQTLYGEFGGIMAGDLAVAKKLSIAPSKVLAPEIALTFNSLFDDPKSDPATYELTPGGKNALRRVAERLAEIRAGMLIVEGHTDIKGSSERNQVESYQRALTIRQVLIDEFGFDESRITAFGLGESQPLSAVLEPGNSERSRRIVFKVVPMSNAM